MNDRFRAGFDRDGFAVARQLFSRREAGRYRGHFMALHRRSPCPPDTAGAGSRAGDPLRRYPRMIQMHRWDPVSLEWLLDARIGDRLLALLGRLPFAVQTMCYFKPPGSRGQALHQDNFYLRASPGTCVAAWLALDPTDEANGCLLVVPGSHRWPILCTTAADTAQSFTDITVPLPPGTRPRPVPMEPGDVLFFNGSLVHGSNPNRTARRFRRSLSSIMLPLTAAGPGIFRLRTWLEGPLYGPLPGLAGGRNSNSKCTLALSFTSKSRHK